MTSEYETISYEVHYITNDCGYTQSFRFDNEKEAEQIYEKMIASGKYIMVAIMEIKRTVHTTKKWFLERD
jgi:hypothetical protein